MHEIVGSGSTSQVYFYDDNKELVYKKYKSFDCAEHYHYIDYMMMNLGDKLHYVVCPKRLKYEYGLYTGYVMDYIKPSGDYANLSKFDLKENYENIFNDFAILNENGIVPSDVSLVNVVLSKNRIHLIDTSGYLTNISSDKIASKTSMQLSYLMYYLFINNQCYGTCSYKEIALIKNQLLECSNISYILNEMGDNESLKEFSQRLVMNIKKGCK